MSQGKTLAATLAQSEVKKKNGGDSSREPGWLISLPGRSCVLTLVVISPWLIGSVHYQTQFVLSVICLVGLCFWWLENLIRRQNDVLPWVSVPVLLGLLLGAVQLVPLADSMASTMAVKQHEIQQEFGSPVENERSQAGAVSTSTRLTIDPTNTRHQISLLTIALAALLLGHHYFHSKSSVLLLTIVVAVNAALVSLFGILQSFYFNGKIYGFFQPEFTGQPFGPFVNRNNAAGYLLMGLGFAIGLAYIVFTEVKPGQPPKPIITKEVPLWTQVKLRFLHFIHSLTPLRIATLVFVNVIVIGIIATLSRGGVLSLLVGSLISVFIFGIVRRPKSTFGIFVASLVLIFGVSTWLGFGDQLMKRFDSINEHANLSDDRRLHNWRDTLPSVTDFRMLGSGLGSYHAVHRMYRTDAEDRLYVHAENQYFQSLVEGGVPALLLLLTALAISIWCAKYLLDRGNSNLTVGAGLIGLFVITTGAIASIFDFGLYIPSNMLLMAISIGFVCGQAHALARRLKKKSILRFTIPRIPTHAIVLAVVAACVLSVVYLHRLNDLDAAMGESPSSWGPTTRTIEETTQQIEKLEPLAVATPTYWGYFRLAELFQHRYRMRELETNQVAAAIDSANLDDERQRKLKSMLWETEALVSQLHRKVFRLLSVAKFTEARKTVSEPDVQENLVKAKEYMARSRELMPLQPELHLQMAQLQVVDGAPESDLFHLERANKIATKNPQIRYFSGLLHLQASVVPRLHEQRVNLACSDLKLSIELEPRNATPIIRLIHDRQLDRWEIEPLRVLNQVIPDSPILLYNFGKNDLKSNELADIKRQAFQRASDMLAEHPATTNFKHTLMSARIYKELGEPENAIGRYRWAKTLEPDDRPCRFELATLLFETEKYEAAMQEAVWLTRQKQSPQLRQYQRLWEKIDAKLAELELNKD